MSLCVHCGQPVLERGGLCTYHLTGHCDDWATGNRIMCDFLHRGIELRARRALDRRSRRRARGGIERV